MRALSLSFDGQTVAVEPGPSRRRAKLTIACDGGLHLTASADVTVEELQDFLESKRRWIYTKLAEKEELSHVHVERELVTGETFQYLGRNYRLQIVDDPGAAGVRLRNGRLQLPAHAIDSGNAAIIDWYKSRGSEWVVPRSVEWSRRLRVNSTALKVADLGRKWGTATPDGRVRFHWATFQLSPMLIDYVVAHELAHISEPHHGAAFWQVLERVMPDYYERKERLARLGAELWFGPREVG